MIKKILRLRKGLTPRHLGSYSSEWQCESRSWQFLLSFKESKSMESSGRCCYSARPEKANVSEKTIVSDEDREPYPARELAAIL